MSHHDATAHSSSSVDESVAEFIQPIRKILTSPDVDLQTISLKGVRRKLVEGGYADEASLTAKKPALDKLIAAIFDQVNKRPGAEKVYDSDEDEVEVEDKDVKVEGTDDLSVIENGLAKL